MKSSEMLVSLSHRHSSMTLASSAFYSI